MSGGFFGSLRKIAEKATVGSWFEKPEDVSPVWEKLSEHKTKCRKTFKDSPKDISMDELFLISSLKTYPVKWADHLGRKRGFDQFSSTISNFCSVCKYKN